MRTLIFVLSVLLLAIQPARAQEAADYKADALSIETLINSRYAYLDRFPDGVFVLSPELRAEADAVFNQATLLRYAEHVLMALADPHAITGASFDESWAIVPSYADLWIQQSGDAWQITAVRAGSPSAQAAVSVGDVLVAVDGVPTRQAVFDLWRPLGFEPSGDRADYGARVLAAGRRDRPRDLTIVDHAGTERRLTLANLYSIQSDDRAVISTGLENDALIIRFNDSLGDNDTVRAFDLAMAQAIRDQPVILDLTDTPSGGNTVVARAIMGWFVDEARPYQIHNLPAEERETGIPRQWVEQVLPRAGKRHHGPITVRVGRWTGSMGEGLAIGLDALGAHVDGGPMAGLRGAIYDYRLERTGLVIKLPTERLYAVDGTPRETFEPHR